MANITLNNNDNIRAGTNRSDTINGRGGDDQLSGRGGADRVNGESGDDILFGGSGDDRLNGGAGDDELNGGSGDDRLNGGAGDDELNGGSGDDTLRGGEGSNVLRGGSGLDEFVFRLGQIDTIEDFNPLQGDKINVSNVGMFEVELIAESGGEPNLIDDGDDGVAVFSDGGDDQLGGMLVIDFADVAPELAPPGGDSILTVIGVSALELEIKGDDIFLT